MSEFICFIDHFKQNDPKYQFYQSQLKINEEKCLKTLYSRIPDPTQPLLNQCYSDRLEFEKGLQFESQNFIDVKRKRIFLMHR